MGVMSGLATFERQPPMQTFRHSRDWAVADIAVRSILCRLWGGLPIDRFWADYGESSLNENKKIGVMKRYVPLLLLSEEV
jgi:hypothetical protein